MENLKIAYLLTFYRDVEHFARLLTNLHGPNIDIYIYNDKKSNVDLKILTGQYDNGNIYVLDDTNIVTWGGFSLCKSIFLLMGACIKNGVYDYILLISGQDFPLANSTQIKSFLRAHKGREFIEYYDLPYANWVNSNGGLDRYEYYWLVDEMGLYKSVDFVEQQKKEGLKRSFFRDLIPYGSSCWFTLTQNMVEYVCKYVEDNQRELFDYFKYVLISDEILIPSVIVNSPYRDKIVNSNHRYIDWRTGPEYPRMLTMADYNDMIKSDCLFARKFSSAIDTKVVDLLEQHITVDKS